MLDTNQFARRSHTGFPSSLHPSVTTSQSSRSKSLTPAWVSASNTDASIPTRLSKRFRRSCKLLPTVKPRGVSRRRFAPQAALSPPPIVSSYSRASGWKLWRRGESRDSLHLHNRAPRHAFQSRPWGSKAELDASLTQMNIFTGGGRVINVFGHLIER